MLFLLLWSENHARKMKMTDIWQMPPTGLAAWFWVSKSKVTVLFFFLKRETHLMCQINEKSEALTSACGETE